MEMVNQWIDACVERNRERLASWIAEHCEVGPHFHDTNAGLW